MNDIDFDELDRAVASALGSAPSSSSSQPQSGAFEPTQDGTHAPAVGRHHAAPLGRRTIVRRRDDASAVDPIADAETAAPIITTPAPLSSPSASQSPAQDKPDNDDIAEASVPRKRIIPHRSGRVMDVVASKQKTAKPISRVAASVAPASESSLARSLEAPIIADVVPGGPTRDIDSSDEENLFASKTSPQNDVPISSLETEKPVVLEERITNFDPVPYETELTTFDESLAKELEQPLTQDTAVSPFLLDAKVEKRPLGGVEASVIESGSDMQLAATDFISASETAQIGAVSTDVTTPAELDRDIVAIESQELDIPDPRKDVEDASSPSPAKLQVTQPPAGPTAITRQYKETPRVASEDDEAGAIFDPQSYHVAIEQPKKRSSGWGWVIAILSIILLAMVLAVLAWMEGILTVPL